MEITLLYFDGCPNWTIADQRLAQLASERRDIHVTRHLVESPEEAERLSFHGSPSILVGGADPFVAPGAVVGLACRLYVTPDGLAGSPTLDQLREAVAQP